jgi:hypothetical protein
MRFECERVVLDLKLVNHNLNWVDIYTYSKGFDLGEDSVGMDVIM